MVVEVLPVTGHFSTPVVIIAVQNFMKTGDELFYYLVKYRGDVHACFLCSQCVNCYIYLVNLCIMASVEFSDSLRNIFRWLYKGTATTIPAHYNVESSDKKAQRHR